MFFLSLLSCNFDDQLFYACWDTSSENTGLWQLPKVSMPLNPGARCSIDDVTYVYIQTALCWQNTVHVMFRWAKRRVVLVRLRVLFYPGGMHANHVMVIEWRQRSHRLYFGGFGTLVCNWSTLYTVPNSPSPILHHHYCIYYIIIILYTCQCFYSYRMMNKSQPVEEETKTKGTRGQVPSKRFQWTHEIRWGSRGLDLVFYRSCKWQSAAQLFS